MERHPIHEWLGTLSPDVVKCLFQLIYPSVRRQVFDRMKRMITSFYFEKSPQAPLSALKKTVKESHFPTSEKQMPNNFEKSPNMTDLMKNFRSSQDMNPALPQSQLCWYVVRSYIFWSFLEVPPCEFFLGENDSNVSSLVE